MDSAVGLATAAVTRARLAQAGEARPNLERPEAERRVATIDATGVATALLGVVCVAFIAMSGRNDGAPLTAIALQVRGDRGWGAMFYLWLLIPLIPLVGIYGVAESLQGLLGSRTHDPAGALALMLAVFVTITIANLTGAPTSITLALVGALTGNALQQGAEVDYALLARVLLLGLLAPLVAAGIAYGLRQLQLPATGFARRVVLGFQRLALPLLISAYAANDGQKVAFVVALALGVTVAEVASLPLWLLLGSTIFLAGVAFGLRSSGKFIRHGIAPVRSRDLLWAEAGASLAVLGGSALGVPLSMTQSLSGAVAGVGMSRSVKSIYWRSVGRIGIAWLWTLPVAAILSYGLASLAAVIF